MRARTAPTAGIPNRLADHYRDQARRYYPGSVGLSAEDCDTLVAELAALGPGLNLDRLEDMVDMDPAGWIRKAVRLTAGAPCLVPGHDLVGVAAADPRVLNGRVWTVNPDGTLTPADITGNGPRTSNSPPGALTSRRVGHVGAAPGSGVPGARRSPVDDL